MDETREPDHYDHSVPSTTLAPAPRHAQPTPALASASAHRADIQALRALAVTSVLLYHLWPNRLPGGYIGVDVFFVISGFLITAHIVREVETTGRLRIAHFWARRARRLLPASLLTLFVTAVGVAALAPGSLWRQFYSEILAATLYVQNWRLAADSVDYLAVQNAPSPVQHFWTLSTEEQFYVALPVVVILCVATARRLRVSPRRAILAALTLLAAASFAYSLQLTSADPGTAYLSTLTRGWEFAAGGLLALVPIRASRWHGALAAIGIAGIGAATVLLAETTPFPGYAALLPVVASQLAIAYGDRTHLSRLGAWGPVAMVGRLSFGIYLWHFPLIVLLPYATGRDLGTVDKVAIAGASFLLAYVSTRFVEDPVRFSPRLLAGRRPSVVAAFGVTGMLLVAAAGIGGLLIDERRTDEARALTAQVLADTPACLGAQARDPLHSPCINPDLEGTVVPELAARSADDANRAECWSSGADGTTNVCQLGPLDAYTKHLFVVGDSHSNTLVGAYERIASAYGWRIDVTGHTGCYWTTADQPASTDELRAGCEDWREGVKAYLAEADDLDAIVVMHAAGRLLPHAVEGETQLETVVRAQAEAWAARPDLSVPVIAIVDNPMTTEDSLACAEQHGPDAGDRCDVPRKQALSTFDGQRETVAVSQNAHVVDLTDWFCDPDVCPAVIGNVLVYRDVDHITATYASTLAPYLGEAISDVLNPSRGPSSSER